VGCRGRGGGRGSGGERVRGRGRREREREREREGVCTGRAGEWQHGGSEFQAANQHLVLFAAPSAAAMSDAEDIVGLAASDDERSEAPCAGNDSEGSSSSPELVCIGCDISSKSACPITRKQKESGDHRVAWGKQSSRLIKKRRPDGALKAIKLKRRCGKWCLLCHNISRKKCQHGRYRKAEQQK